MSTELKRLLDEPGSDLDRVLLESALDEAPPSKSLDKTLAALGLGTAVALGAASTSTVAGGAAAGGVGTTSAVAGKAAGGWLTLTLAKVVAGVAIAGVAIGGGYVVTRSDSIGTAPAKTTPIELGSDARASVAGEVGDDSLRAGTSEDESSVDPNRAPHRIVIDPEARSDREAAKREVVADASPVGAAGSPQTNASLASGNDGSANAGPRSPASSTERTKSSEPRSTKTSRADESDVAGAEQLGAETRLIEQARIALESGNYDAALSRIAAYEHRFPKGQMREGAARVKAAALKKKEGK